MSRDMSQDEKNFEKVCKKARALNGKKSINIYDTNSMLRTIEAFLADCTEPYIRDQARFLHGVFKNIATKLLKHEEISYLPLETFLLNR